MCSRSNGWQKHWWKTHWSVGLWLIISIAAAQPGLAQDYIHVTQPGDTLIDLAQRYLREPQQWPRLQQRNRVANPRQLQPHTRLRIPLALMRRESLSARLISVQGDVAISHAGQSLTLNSDGSSALPALPTIPEGSLVKTGANGFVLLQLADGSMLRIPSQSQARLTRLQRITHTQSYDTEIQLDAGRVEPQVAPQRATQSRFQVRTPQAIAGVRGTRFRVGTQASQTTSEVLSGAVDVAVNKNHVLLQPGYATLVALDGKPSAPIALLPAPDLRRINTQQERPVLRAQFAALADARQYRARLAQDADLTRVLREAVLTQPEAKFTDLPDGVYHLQVRGIDARGIEGQDAQQQLELNAQPTPPITQHPAQRGKVRANEVVFVWNEHPAARHYHLQVAQEAQFQQLLINQSQLTGTEFRTSALPLGDYYWRIASDATGTPNLNDPQPKGPFGDAQSFSLRAPPSVPQAPKEEAQQLHFAWSGEAGQQFLLQIARDAQFTQIVHNQTVAQPEARINRPPAGHYFVRTQATDSDGFVGPFSPAQKFEIIQQWHSGDGQPIQSSGGSIRTN